MIIPPDGQSLLLADDVSPSAMVIRVYGRFVKTSESASTKYKIGAQIGVLSPFTDGGEEKVYINIVADPSLVAGTTNVYEYPVTTKSLDSDNQTIPPTKYGSVASKTHYAQRARFILAVTGETLAQGKIGTVEDQIAAGEELTTGDTVSIDSSTGKLFKYHDTNYPNEYGVIDGGTYAIDALATVITFGGEFVNASGLTPGVDVYFENTGTYTEIPSPTTTIMGKAVTATKIRLAFTTDVVDESSKTEAEAGVVQNVYNSPKRTSQAIQAGNAIYGADKNSALNGAIASVADNGSGKARFTDVAHGLVTGKYITIAGCSDSAYNGQFEITRIDDDNFDTSAVYTATDTGTWSGTDAYVIALAVPITAYSVGQTFAFMAANANTGAATIDIDGLGAKTIVKESDTTLVGNDIKAGQIVTIAYNGTKFQMKSSSGIAATTTDITTAGLTVSSGVDVFSASASKVVTHGLGKTPKAILMWFDIAEFGGTSFHTPTGIQNIRRSSGFMTTVETSSVGTTTFTVTLGGIFSTNFSFMVIG